MDALSDLQIRTSTGSYTVAVRRGAFDDALARADVVITDALFADRLTEQHRPVISVVADERDKTMSRAERLIVELRDAGARRGTVILGVGGGVVQDLVTLTASLYMRGIPWIYAPTTLMAQADSCIGGKSSINAGNVKNLVGNIYPPVHVAVDPVFVESLSPEAMSAGWSEAVKICFCHGSERFSRYLELFERVEAGDTDIATLVHHVLETKQWFIEVDEFDQSERLLLNFGHTFGHALEVAVGYRISHGVGVAIGILAAIGFADDARDDRTKLLGEHCHKLLEQVPGLAARLAAFDDVVFERSFRSDKKHTNDSFCLIRPVPGGGVRRTFVPADATNMRSVMQAIRGALAEVGP